MGPWLSTAVPWPASVPATLERRLPMASIDLSTEPDYTRTDLKTPLPRLERKLRQRNSSASGSDNKPLLSTGSSRGSGLRSGRARYGGLSSLRRVKAETCPYSTRRFSSSVRPRDLSRSVISRSTLEDRFCTSVAQNTWQSGAVMLVPASNVGCVRRVPAI